MITVNTYVVTERAVYEGVAQAIPKIMSDPALMAKPENVVSAIADSVLQELCGVLDFGVQPIRFTPDVMQKLLAHAQSQQTEQEQQVGEQA